MFHKSFLCASRPLCPVTQFYEGLRPEQEWLWKYGKINFRTVASPKSAPVPEAGPLEVDPSNIVFSCGASRIAESGPLPSLPRRVDSHRTRGWGLAKSNRPGPFKA